jgi:hypothetical protein
MPKWWDGIKIESLELLIECSNLKHIQAIRMTVGARSLAMLTIFIDMNLINV